MPADIGPHLLGRKRHAAEPGDWKLEKHLEVDTITPAQLVTYLNDAIAALGPLEFVPAIGQVVRVMQEVVAVLSMTETVSATDLRSVLEEVISELSSYASTPMVVAIIQLLQDVVNGMPSPAPPTSTSPVPTTPVPSTPVPSTPAPTTNSEWVDYAQLDQGKTGHCVGFGTSGFLASEPVADQGVTNETAHALYYWIKANIDGEPGAEDGSTVHSAAKALVHQGRLKSYAWASTVGAMQTWVTTKGPVLMGTDWDNNMFNPNSKGFIAPGGGVAGGHCYLMLWYDKSLDAFEFVNSWGKSWAKGGHFFMKTADFTSLWHRSGNEAMAALELPLAS